MIINICYRKLHSNFFAELPTEQLLFLSCFDTVLEGLLYNNFSRASSINLPFLKFLLSFKGY